jgi:hypothetical protein
MKTKMYIVWASLAVVLLFSSCQENENVTFVREAFETMDDPAKLRKKYVIDSSENWKKRSSKVMLEGFVYPMELKLKENPKNPAKVDYSCKIPGAATVILSNMLNKWARLDEKCKDIEMSGTLTVETDGKTGKKGIRISDGDNPLSICLDIAYCAGITESLLELLKDDESLSLAVTLMSFAVSEAYENALGKSDYFDKIVRPELTACFDSEEALSAGLSDTSPIKKEQEKRRIPENLLWVGGGIVIFVLSICFFFGIQKIKKEDEENPLIQAIKKDNEEKLEKKMEEEMKDLATIIKLYKKPHKKKKNYVSILAHTYSKENEATKYGWSLATLGRNISIDATPETFKQAMKKYSIVAEEYQNMVKQYQEKVEKHNETLDRYNALKNPSGKTESIGTIIKKLEPEIRNLRYDIESLEKEINNGFLDYLTKRCLPFGFLIHVIGDTQNTYDRFLRQGAIMGMLAFLMKYKDHPDIKPYYEQLLASRADLIHSDSNMSFFEVRVPKSYTSEQYADTLKQILWCANPAIKYCNIRKLIKIAQKQIPNIMDLLIKYPLRLIDPGNQTTDGFYEFRPYNHAMWIQYTPPKDTGKVIRRYHEALDMTFPNSSGLNIRLFTDPYAVIPVMFHEYNHFRGDNNEASVFLKTQLFSQKFYREHRQADPSKDPTFVTLATILGTPPNSEACQQLNDLIRTYYGETLSQEQGQLLAEVKINQLNTQIRLMNRSATWDPEIVFPLLADKPLESDDTKRPADINWDLLKKSFPSLADELLESDDTKYPVDPDTRDIIKRAIIRAATAPKSITKEEFEAIVSTGTRTFV